MDRNFSVGPEGSPTDPKDLAPAIPGVNMLSILVVENMSSLAPSLEILDDFGDINSGEIGAIFFFMGDFFGCMQYHNTTHVTPSKRIDPRFGQVV